MSPDPEIAKKIETSATLDAEGTHEVILREGIRELERTTPALLWSGLAAGLSMGFSFLAEGLLRSHLPDTSWRPLVAKLGYCVGFLIVVLGKQQLFTENTLTPIVPLMNDFSGERLRNVLRLWGAVLLTNLIGALMFATALGRLAVVEPPVQRALGDLAREAMQHGAPVTLLHAIYAGWLIALMVWMLPGADTAKALVIIVMSYLVGVGGFAHVIAGSTEVFYALVRGERSIMEVTLGFVLPTLVGNVIGGVMLVASVNHAQAKGDDS